MVFALAPLMATITGEACAIPPSPFVISMEFLVECDAEDGGGAASEAGGGGSVSLSLCELPTPSFVEMLRLIAAAMPPTPLPLLLLASTSTFEQLSEVNLVVEPPPPPTLWRLVRDELSADS